jgi:hypothetical protein
MNEYYLSISRAHSTRWSYHRTPDLDIVVEGVVSPRDVHHKCWDKNMMPDLTIDIAWKIVVLEFLVLCHFDFFFGHECLV